MKNADLTFECHVPRRKPNRTVSAAVLAPKGAENGDLDDKIAAIVMAASKHLKILPRRMSFPKNTSNGSLASCWPRGVRSSAFVKALTSIRASTARLIFFAEGGSRA